MSDTIYHKKTHNWVKGVFALNKTREALYKCIYYILERFINEDPNKQKKHLKQFFLCLNKHNIQRLKQLKPQNQKKKAINISCEHEVCSILMKDFVKIHVDNQTLCNYYRWMTVPRQSASPSTERPIRVKSITGQDEETTEIMWQITVLYMVIDKGDKVQQYRCLDDLDISKIIKMMMSCTIFVPDGSLKLYETVKNLRNDLMHSPDNHMEDDKVIEVITVSKELLDCLQISKTTFYKRAMQELQKLQDNDIYIGYVSLETKSKGILKKVINAKDMAATLDKAIDDDNKECKDKSKQLFDLLEKCQTDILQMQPMVFQPKEYKEIVKSCMEKQVKAINDDMALLDKQSLRYSGLKRIRHSIETKMKTFVHESENHERAKFQENTNEQFTTDSLNTETQDVMHGSENDEQATCQENTTEQFTTDSEKTETQKYLDESVNDERATSQENTNEHITTDSLNTETQEVLYGCENDEQATSQDNTTEQFTIDSEKTETQEFLHESENDESASFQEKPNEQFTTDSVNKETQEFLHKSKDDERATFQENTIDQFTTESGYTVMQEVSHEGENAEMVTFKKTTNEQCTTDSGITEKQEECFGTQVWLAATGILLTAVGAAVVYRVWGSFLLHKLNDN